MRAPAQVITWTNPADGNWSAGSNWEGGAAPPSSPTTALLFGLPPTQAATYTATNDVTDPFLLNALSFNNTTGAVTLAGSGLTFAGASPTLTQSGAGAAIVNTPVTLAASTSVGGAGSGPVTFNEAISGGMNNLIKASDGPLTLAGGGSMNVLQLTAGTTNVTDGTLALTLANNTAASLLLGTAAGQTVILNQTGGRINFTENARIGQAAGASATLNVSGTGAVLDNTLERPTGLLRVGDNGDGNLNVTDGGLVNIRNLYVGAGRGSTGDMVIDGPTSMVNSTDMFRVGNSGTGTLTVRNSGTLNAGTVNRAFALIVGNTGVGTLTLRDGGTVTSPVAYVGYGGDAGLTGTGTFTVSGVGSTFTVGTPTVAGELGVGMTELGTGTLNIQEGGLVTVNGSAIGAYFDGRGTINVADAGSLLRVTGRLSLGGEFSDAPGTATLNVGSGGTVTVAGRAQLQNTATINLNAGGMMSVGGLDDGPRNGNGVVNLAAGTTLTLTNGTETFRGTIRGEGALSKIGAGVQTLAGVNTYTGNTTVSAGTLRLSGSGSLAASPRIIVDGGAMLDVAGVTGGANFGNGGFALAADQVLAGSGNVNGSVTIAGNSAIAPGEDDVDQLNLGNSNWGGGGRYLFEFNSLTPVAGMSNDFISGTGLLDLSATAASPFVIDIRGVNFSSPSATPVSYTVATFSGGVSGFDQAAFAFPSTEWFADTPSIALQGNNLVLTFTPVPEPSSVFLAAVGLALLPVYVRRKLIFARCQA